MSKKSCSAGTCEHADFPHTVVIVPATIRVGKASGRNAATITEVPGVTYVICSACKHWAGSGAHCDCEAGCHKNSARVHPA